MLGYFITLSCLLAVRAATITTTEEVPTTEVYSGLGCQSMCCDGKNNTCHSQGLKMNGKGNVNSLCFCDEGCPAMGDCCFDYATACTGE